MHTLTLVREGRRAVLPIPLQQDAKVFGAQGILSSGKVTDVVVFMHLLVDVLTKSVNIGRVIVIHEWRELAVPVSLVAEYTSP